MKKAAEANPQSGRVQYALGVLAETERRRRGGEGGLPQDRAARPAERPGAVPPRHRRAQPERPRRGRGALPEVRRQRTRGDARSRGGEVPDRHAAEEVAGRRARERARAAESRRRRAGGRAGAHGGPPGAGPAIAGRRTRVQLGGAGRRARRRRPRQEGPHGRGPHEGRARGPRGGRAQGDHRLPLRRARGGAGRGSRRLAPCGPRGRRGDGRRAGCTAGRGRAAPHARHAGLRLARRRRAACSRATPRSTSLRKEARADVFFSVFYLGNRLRLLQQFTNDRALLAAAVERACSTLDPSGVPPSAAAMDTAAGNANRANDRAASTGDAAMARRRRGGGRRRGPGRGRGRVRQRRAAGGRDGGVDRAQPARQQLAVRPLRARPAAAAASPGARRSSTSPWACRCRTSSSSCTARW